MRLYITLCALYLSLGLCAQERPTKEIETVTIIDQSDPKALKLLDQVNEHFKQNSPQSLSSYAFKSYEKYSLDFDKDSIQAYKDFIAQRQDSLKQLPKVEMSKKKVKDSLIEEDIYTTVTESKFFLWERAQNFLYYEKYGEKVKVLDHRISGLKEIPYEILALTSSNRNREPKEIKKENRALYRFFLADSIQIEGRPTYVIRFRTAGKKKTPRKYNGYIYIDQQTFGIKKIHNERQKEGASQLTSTWTLRDGKWFLQREHAKIKAGNMKFLVNKDEKHYKKFGNYLFVDSYYFDFKAPIPQINPDDFKGYTLDIDHADGSKIEEYRKEDLSEREQMAYEKIDSLGQKYKVDKKLKFLTTLLHGKIRWGKVDFDAAEFGKYNLYEGIRIGASAKLNEKFNRYISPDAYFAYGFKDQAIKYGIGVDFKTSLQKNSIFRLAYYDDVTSAGRFNESFWNFKMKIMNSGVDMNNDRFFGFKGFKVGYETDFGNSISTRITWSTQKEGALFPYEYKNLGYKFNNQSAMLSLKYAPEAKNVMTPNGRFTYDEGNKALYLNFEQGLSAFNYSKLDMLYTHYFNNAWGKTGVRVNGGWLFGEAPIWHQFEIPGLNASKGGTNFNLTSYLGFATMDSRKYYADRFISAYITHRIPWNFKSFGRNISNFDVVYRAAIGDMKHPEYHHFDFETLNHLYQEVGVEWNNFLSTSFNLGFFYRVGHYNTASFKDNFAIQLKLKFLGF